MSNTTHAPIPTLQKAAILLIALGEETSAKCLRLLSEPDLTRVTRHIAQLGAISSQEIEGVLSEFYEMIAAQEAGNRGGMATASRMVTAAFGEQQAKPIIESIESGLRRVMGSLQKIEKLDPRQLAQLLATEHPQTVALVLSQVNAGLASKLIPMLPQPFAIDVVGRMAKLDEVAPEIIDEIVGVLAEQLSGVAPAARMRFSGVKTVADLCARLGVDTSKAILDAIELSDGSIAERIRKVMFEFEDILKLDDEAMKALLSRADRKTLVIALKGTSEALKDHFTKRMSGRAKQMLLEDLDALGPIRIRDVDNAQQEIIGVVRELEGEGIVTLGNSSAEDQYVH
jgi:flagellar motor switch protein FliG